MSLLETVLFWTEKMVAFALLLQTIELLALRKFFSDDGIWQWRILNKELNVFPAFVQSSLRIFLRMPNFLVLLAVQLMLAILLLGVSDPWILLALFLSSALISVRFRGAFNGGSDYMTLIVLSALVVARAWPDLSVAAVFYIGIQCTLSYFVAGLVKLKERRWRNGLMLRDFLLRTNFGVPSRVQALISNVSPWWGGAIAWVVILFESLFPLHFISSSTSLAFLSAAFLFHVMNVYVLGLNRFLFIWVATYPSVYFLGFWLRTEVFRL